jgi:cytoskeleton protein RodZ
MKNRDFVAIGDRDGGARIPAPFQALKSLGRIGRPARALGRRVVFRVLGFGWQPNDYSERFSWPATGFPSSLTQRQTALWLQRPALPALTPLGPTPIFFGGPSGMPATPFGERLKREREMRGVTLQEISTATRISTRFLEALENEQWNQLPGGVFNRGFIRSIARFLGLDEESLVAEYALGTKGLDDVRSSGARPAEIPRDWRPIAAVTFIVVAVLGGIIALYHYGPILVSRLRARRHPAVVQSAPPAVTSGDPSKTLPGIARAPSLAPMALQIAMLRSAAVRITADGKVVFSGQLRRKDVKKFEADRDFEVASSKPNAMRLELNGQPVLSSPQGKTANRTLTRADLEPPTGGAH